MPKLKLFISFFLILILCITFVLPCFAEETTYVWSSSSTPVNANISEDSTNYTDASNDEINSTTANESETNNNTLNLESASAILIEQSTGQILYEHNCHEALRPASVTKVMSILLIMEALDNGTISLNDTVPCSENAASMGGSQIWLDPRETLTVDEMLKAICVASANDCVVAMAEYLAGSEEAFVQMMNDKAKELGMNDTTFKNCHGLDEDGHVTSSYDISLMSKELLNNHPQITNYTTIWTDSLRDGKSELTNTNKLIRTYKGATGLKTGSTGLALYNLSASATRDNLSLIAVIMKAPSTKVRFEEAQKLLDYGFSNFSFRQFGKKEEVVKSLSVTKGVCSSVDAILLDNAGTIIEKGKDKNIEQNLILENTISAPISAGQKLGEVSFVLDGKTLSTVDIVAKNDVAKINLFTMSKKVIYSWIDLLRS
ncbi:MAG: D-alanyl-D-alanine carboxypeptidase [Clostridia bacterium]|nr:D-alanyl-D-alanine carboxypeptidase [Clostridia bacterium]